MASNLLKIHLLWILPLIALGMPLPTALPARPFTIVINNETYYEIGNITHPRSSPPRPLPHCRNVTLHQKAYTLFENGSLRIEVLNVTLNSSSSYRRSTSGLVTACVPSDPHGEWLRALVASTVPPAIVLFTLNFVSGHIRELRMCVCLLCMIIYLLDFAIMFVCSLASSGGNALDMQLRFLSLASLFMIYLSSWTPLVTSAVAVKYLEAKGVVSVEKGKVVVRKTCLVVLLVSILLTLIMGLTLAIKVYPKVLHLTGYERGPSFEEEFARLPGVYVMAWLNLAVFTISKFTYGVKFYDPRLRYTKSNSMFLKTYVAMLGLWTVGEVLGSYFFLDLSPVVFFMISVLMPLFIPHFEVARKTIVIPDVIVMSETGQILPELVQEA